MRLSFETFGEGAAEGSGAAPALVVCHGLLGSGRNWGSLARRMGRRRRVIVVDMRNHGDSPWDDRCDYPAMAQDIAETVEAEAGGRADLLGHSMGGKAAMALALSRPQAIRRLVVADIAPVAYAHSHADVIAAMAGLDLSAVTRRAEADAALEAGVPDPAMRAFVAHNLAFEAAGARWRPNLAALGAAMADLVGFPPGPWPAAPFTGPALFLRGGRSDYVTDAMRPTIAALFPAARVETVEGAGHWLHAEAPHAFLEAVEAFLDAD